jgi:TonB-dependent starch-binding outer membrane protein SusC
MMKKFLTMMLLVTFSCVTSYAQRMITGKVTDASGEPLIGANVVAKEDANIGTITDVDGNFTLNVGSIVTALVVSYTGYNTTDVKLTTEANYEVKLQVGQLLDELVVVGYGSQKRSDITGSVSQINSGNIEKLVVTSIDQAMQGQAAGVQVTSASGTPGGSVNVKVRGNSSISSGSQPLYVIDGVPIAEGNFSQIGFGNQITNALANLNPSEIESMEILKDAAASAIYGSRAANGVVLITTKRGASQKTKIEINSYYGSQNVWKTIEPATGPEYVALIQEMVRNRTGNPASLPSSQGLRNLDADPATYPNTNWQDEILQTAPISQTDLSFQGGNESTKFYLSGSFFTQDGIIKGSGFDRYSFRANLDNNVNKRLKIGNSTSISRTKSLRINNDNNINGVLSAAFLTASHIPVYNPDGTYAKDVNASVENPVAAYKEPTNDAFNNRILSSIFGEYNIAKGWNFTTRFSLDYIGFEEFRFSPTTLNSGAGVNGLAVEAGATDLNLINENFTNYTNSFGKLNFDILLGTSFQSNESRTFFGQGENFPGNTIKTLNAASVKKDLSSGRSAYGLNSYFSRLNMNFDEKYYITASLRADGSSRFGANQRWGVFPAFAVSYRVSEESFLKGNNTISDLKIRASWGIRGNQDIANFASRGFISPNNNYLMRAGLAPTSLGNPNLTWEERTDIDLGLILGLFKNRLSFEIDLYEGVTNQLLLNRPLVGSSGFTGINENIGSLKNRGIDGSMKIFIVDNSKFTWKTTINASAFESEITKLAGTPFAAGFASWVQEGEALGAFRGFRAERIFQTQAEIDALNTTAREKTGRATALYQTSLTRPGDIQFKDLDKDGVITTSDQEILGNANPKVFGGITNEFSFGGIDFSFFFQGSYGNLLFNNTRAFAEGMNGVFGQAGSVKNRWTPTNPTTDIKYPRAVLGDPNNNRRTSDRFLEDGSYLRLKNVNIGYKIPSDVTKRLGLSSLRIFAGGQNLLTFTKYTGFDPEVSTFANSNTAPGTDFLTFPQARVVTGGINIQF